MKRTVVAALVVMLLVSGFAVGCAPEPVEGSGSLSTVIVDNISGYTRVEARGSIPIEVVRADSYTTTIVTDDNIAQYVDVSKKGNTLVVRLTRAIEPTSFEVTVTMPDLLSVRAVDASRVLVEGFDSADDFSVELRGTSVLEMSNIAAGKATFDVDEASVVAGEIAADEIELALFNASVAIMEGSTTDLTIKVRSTSVAQLRDLAAQNVDVLLRRVGRAEVQAEQELVAVLQEASTLGYVGDPTGEITKSYSSRVYKIDE